MKGDMILADIELAAIAILSWWLGVFCHVLWQNWRARPAKPIPPQWVPRSLSEEIAATERAEQRKIDSPFAPKQKFKLTRVEKPKPSARLDRLRHWPRAIPEPEKPPAMVEARPRQVEQPAQSIEPWHARDALPKIEFGSGAKP